MRDACLDIFDQIGMNPHLDLLPARDLRERPPDSLVDRTAGLMLDLAGVALIVGIVWAIAPFA